MFVTVYGSEEGSLWTAADVVGADLSFRRGDEYRVVVYVDGYEVGETRKHRSSRDWVRWLRSLR